MGQGSKRDNNNSSIAFIIFRPNLVHLVFSIKCYKNLRAQGWVEVRMERVENLCLFGNNGDVNRSYRGITINEEECETGT